MKQLLQNIKAALVFVSVLSFALLIGIVVQQHRSQNSLMAAAGENKETLRSRYAQAGSILSIDNVVLAESVDGERTYASLRSRLRISWVTIPTTYRIRSRRSIRVRYSAPIATRSTSSCSM